MRALLLLALVVSSSGGIQTATTIDPGREDQNVLRVILDRIIVPELAKFGRRDPAAMLVVEDQTIALSGTGKIPDRWQMALKPDSSNRWPGLIADDSRRQRIISSFEDRNDRPHPLPDLSRSDVMRVESGRVAEVREEYRDRPIGVARFSLPGYSLDGYALVAVSYGCGNLCGASGLVVLDNATRSWRIANAFPLSAS